MSGALETRSERERRESAEWEAERLRAAEAQQRRVWEVTLVGVKQDLGIASTDVARLEALERTVRAELAAARAAGADRWLLENLEDVLAALEGRTLDAVGTVAAACDQRGLARPRRLLSLRRLKQSVERLECEQAELAEKLASLGVATE